MAVDFNLILMALQQKLQLFQDLAAISVKQLDFLNTHNAIDDLLEQMEQFIKTRDKVIRKLDLLEERIIEYRNDLGINDLAYCEIKGRFIPDQYQAYVKYNEEIHGVITFIQANDFKSQKLIRKSLDGIGNKINQTREHKKASNAYNPHDVYSEAWYFDKKK